MGLKERCEDFLIWSGVRRNPSARQIDELVNFIVSEIGRAASSTLEDSLPLCLYFTTEKDREEFIALIHEAKPDMISKRWPQ